MASSCRQKIIATLARVKKTHMMDLVRKVNSTYTQVNRNLRILEQEDIIESQYYGRLRIIRLNKENPKTEAILKALRMLRNPQLVDRK
jgi:DeoR/GlpR family transcriptional regulator of sugar metabolism